MKIDEEIIINVLKK
ncbi:hypothetical protein [Clostridium cochlearium]